LPVYRLCRREAFALLPETAPSPPEMLLPPRFCRPAPETAPDAVRAALFFTPRPQEIQKKSPRRAKQRVQKLKAVA